MTNKVPKTYFEINKIIKSNTKTNINTKTSCNTSTYIQSFPNSQLYTHLTNLIESQETIEKYTNIQENIIPTRGNIIDWLLVVADRIKITQETFFKAITIFDKYISKLTTEIIDPNKLQFIAVICFFIAYKFEETGVMTLDFVESKLLHFKYTKKDIVAQETNILLTINFKLNFPTINTFTNIIIEAIKTLPSIKNEDNKNNFISKLSCIFNFVNKISLFVDEFIFGVKCFKISLINTKTTLMLMKEMRFITNENYKEIEQLIDDLSKDYITNEKQIDIMASGLYLAIINQEKQGSHKNLFQSYYNNIEQIFKQEMVKSF